MRVIQCLIWICLVLLSLKTVVDLIEELQLFMDPTISYLDNLEHCGKLEDHEN